MAYKDCIGLLLFVTEDRAINCWKTHRLDTDSEVWNQARELCMLDLVPETPSAWKLLFWLEWGGAKWHVFGTWQHLRIHKCPFRSSSSKVHHLFMLFSNRRCAEDEWNSNGVGIYQIGLLNQWWLRTGSNVLLAKHSPALSVDPYEGMDGTASSPNWLIITKSWMHTNTPCNQSASMWGNQDSMRQCQDYQSPGMPYLLWTTFVLPYI